MPRSRMITQESGALRRRVAHLIDTVTLDPPGMSPSSILLVRRMGDPLPRRLSPHPEAVRADPEWEGAARTKLSEFHRRAARPIHGFVPGSAEAIVFADQSELLACLARDVVSGQAALLWWWRAILRNLPPGMIEALVAAWRREARYVPAAIHLLNAGGDAVGILSRFSPTQAWSILQEIAREFAISLPSSRGTLFIPVQPSLEGSGPAEFNDQLHHSSQRVEKAATTPVAAPWHELSSMPTLPGSFGRERSALLGVSLLLHWAPQTTRTARFPQTFSAWYRNAEGARIPGAASAPFAPALQISDPNSASAAITTAPLTSAASQDTTTQGASELSAFDKQARLVSSEIKASAADRLEATSEIDRVTEQCVEAEAGLRHRKSGVAPVTGPFSDESLPAQRIQWIIEEKAPTPNTVEAGPPTELSTMPPAALMGEPQNLAPGHHAEGEPVPTELGGALFLVNLLLALKLPELLETDFDGGPISGWDLLELVARSLLGRREPGLAGDGIWAVLAQLAGRPADVPIAAEFHPHKCYRIPSFWMDALRPQGAQVFGVRLRDTRLQLWHQQGFMLADCLGDRMFSRADIQQECGVYCQEDELPTLSSWRGIVKPALAGCGNASVKARGLRRLLAFLLPYLRWRLCVALGLTGPHALSEALLLRRGYIYATRTHLDLTMNLNQATAPVRMAGLDADPGWVPRLGRVIKFSFVTEGPA